MIKKIINQIDKYSNIILSAHINPDGDALGSLLAFKYMIEKYDKNKNVTIVLQDKLPKYIYDFKEAKDIKNNYYDNVELIITLDCANKERVALEEKFFKMAKQTINIDHHISNTFHQNINYVKEISSTCELLFKFIPYFNIKLDKKIASFLYLGIINDTGNFRHKNVTKNTFNCVSLLMDYNIDTNYIYNSLFKKSKLKAKVFGNALSKYVYNEKYKFAYYYISKEKIKKLNATSDDLDGISELLINIEGVEISLFLKEDENSMLKGSFRSKKIDVNKLASNFNGGGHILAVGFKTDIDKNKIIRIILKNLKKERNN